MKLRNKKTGEIGNLKSFNNDKRVYVWINKETDLDYIYNSLAELNEEWEDYEEPKEDCITDLLEWISDVGPILHNSGADDAVEKLKAWKRLKNKGFKFVKISQGILGGEIRYKTNEESEEVVELLNLLFGGEE